MIKSLSMISFLLFASFLQAQTNSDNTPYKTENPALFQTNANVWISLKDRQNSFQLGWNQNWNDTYYGLISTDSYRARLVLGFHRQVSEHWMFGFQSYLHFLDQSTFNMAQTQGYLLHIGKIGKTYFGQQLTLAHQYFGKNTFGNNRRPAEGKAHLRAFIAHPFTLSNRTTLWIQASGYLAWQINWNGENPIYKYNQRFVDQTQWSIHAGIDLGKVVYAGAYIQYICNYYQTAAAVDPVRNVRTPMIGIQCMISVGKFDSDTWVPLFHP